MAVYLTDDTGVRKRVVAGWYSDGAAMRPVRCMWVGDSAGALRKSDDCIGGVEVDIQPLSHTSVRVVWSAPGASKVRIYGIGNPDPLLGEYETVTGSADYHGFAPNQYVEVYAVGYDAQNNATGSPHDSTYTSEMPAPASITSGEETTTTYKLSWGAVTAASKYDVYNADNNAVISSPTVAELTRTGLTPGGVYRAYVKAVHAGGQASQASATSSITLKNSFPAGTYFFYAHSCDTWQMGAKTWRGTSAGKVWHGDGAKWSAAGGSREACFFDYREYYGGKSIQSFFAGLPVNVTKVQIRTKRNAEQHGIWSPQTCQYRRHINASKPAGAPAYHWEAVQPGTLNLGENKWFELPVHWGREWIAGTVMGMIWGGTPYYSTGAGYMVGPDLANMSNQCEVAITVG